MPARRTWWPRPRVSASEANSRWTVHRCIECGRFCATLVASEHIEDGQELVVPQDDHVVGHRDSLGQFELTFDGGARPCPGGRVAGAGAVLWGPPGPEGRQAIARILVAMPGEQHAQIAEARAAAAGLDLLLSQSPDTRYAAVAGDNLAVVRFCCAQGRLRQPAMHQLLDPRLSTAHERGWVLDWQAVRRRLNCEADEVATMAVRWAASLFAQGIMDERSRTDWL